jgi:hypothetical protein
VTQPTTPKYDIDLILQRMVEFVRSSPPALSDEAGGEEECLDQLRDLRHPELWERFATDLQARLRAAHPGARVEAGNSWDLAADEMYSGGSCDLPPPDLPVREAYVRIWVQRKWGPLWIFFTPKGMELCKTSPHERKGLIFAAKPICSVDYENPRFFPLLERALSTLGFPFTWGH